MIRKSTLAIAILLLALGYMIWTFVPIDVNANLHLSNGMQVNAQGNTPTPTAGIPVMQVQPTATPVTPSCADLQNGGVVVDPLGLPRLSDWANSTGLGKAFEFAADTENRTLGNIVSYAQDLYHGATNKWPTANMVISLHLPESQYSKFLFLDQGFTNVEGFGLIGEFPANKSDWNLLDTATMKDTGADKGLTIVFWDNLNPNVLPPAEKWIEQRVALCPNWVSTPVAP